MIGTTARWWRAFLYLGALAAFRDEIATYTIPWVDKINNQLGTHLTSENAALISIPLLMGVALAIDKILIQSLIAIRLYLIILLFLLTCAVCMMLTEAETNGKCGPFNTWADVLSCKPVVMQSLLDHAKPILDDWMPRARAFPWLPFGISVLGSVLPATVKYGFEIGKILLWVLIGLPVLFLIGWVVFLVGGIIEHAILSAFSKHDDTRLPLPPER
jgi:hypothetical protein